MATTDRTDAVAPAGALANRLGEASFAHLLVRADAESIAAAGLLADACVSTGTPYQVSAVRTRADADTRAGAVDEDATVVSVGVDAEDGRAGTHALGERSSATAFQAAEALGTDPDPVLALAGVVAGGATPEDATPSIVERADVERRPGLATPTADPADGLAHTTLAHADYSGDPATAEEVVVDLREGDENDYGDVGDGDATDDVDAANRRLASLLVIDAVSADGATRRAAAVIDRAIHPLAGGPLETVGGYADVLGALAATAPGLGVSVALGRDSGNLAERALDAWREHAAAVHGAVRGADTERHAGLLVARADGPVEAVARLLRDFRSPEPAVLALREGDVDDGVEAALATVDAPAEPIETAAAAAGGSGLARGDAGYARFDADRQAEFVDAVRGAL